jgi:hypothetical protein
MFDNNFMNVDEDFVVMAYDNHSVFDTLPSLD